MARRLVLRVRLALVGTLLLPLVSCESAVGPAPAPSRLAQRGFTLGDWTPQEIAGPSGTRALDEIAAAGANFAVLLVTAHQAAAASSAFDAPSSITPARDALLSAASAASARGLAVAVKLHIDVDDGTWRGQIRPADPDAWFDAYRALVEDYASAAAAASASTFVVGTELAGTIEHEARWRDVVAAARARFDGEVVYAASWDEAERVPFWDAVDAVGVNFYFPVAGRANAGRLELLAGWQPWLDRLQSLNRRTGRPVILTEVGYRSVDGAGMDPAIWTTSGRVDVAEQADLYWTAITAAASAPFVRGLWWWNWEVGAAGGPDDPGYTPRGKPAIEVVTAAWGSSS